MMTKPLSWGSEIDLPISFSPYIAMPAVRRRIRLRALLVSACLFAVKCTVDDTVDCAEDTAVCKQNQQQFHAEVTPLSVQLVI